MTTPADPPAAPTPDNETDRLAAVLAQSPPPQLNVLVVDDQHEVVEVAAELMTLCGCNVRIASSGSEALRAASECMPDLVMLDIVMPEMTGWDVARRLRALPGGKEPFVVAVTGYAREDDRASSASAGIDLHWVKPLDPSNLIRLLAQLRGLTA